LAATEDNTAAVEGNTAAINRERAVRDRLSGALEGLGGVLGGVIRGAPQALSPIMDSIPGMKAFAGMMGFAEGYIGVWQQLTDRGINFSNQIDTMITSVGRANLQMEDFIRITQATSNGIVGLGGTADRGAQLFLTNQAEFMRLGSEYEPLRRRLLRLGMTSTDIAERFAEFDQIAIISNMRQMRDQRERNIAASEFAENLDELAKLTGKQVDQLSEEAAEIARRGNVFAFGQQIDESVRDELNQGLLNMNQLGPEIGKYAMDLITRGFPDPNDPEMLLLHSQAGETRELLLAARNALLEGNGALAEEYFKMARETGRSLQDNATIQMMAMYGNATQFTGAAVNILESGLTSSMVLARNAVVEEAKKLAEESGETFTGSREQLLAAAENLIKAERDTQVDGAPDSPGEEALRMYIDQLMKMQGTAADLQEVAVSAAISGSVTALNALSEQLQNFDLNETVNEALAEAIGLGASIAAGLAPSASTSRQSQRMEDQLNQLAQALRANGQNTEADRVSALATELTRARTTFEGNQTTETGTAFDLAMGAARAEIMANRDVFVTGNEVTIGGVAIQAFGDIMRKIGEALGVEFDDMNVGTLGRFGRLFQNFGRETTVDLHGMEAVVTPEQMAAIVQQSALGALSASMQVMETTNARSTTGMLNGMLNTIRTIPEQMSQGSNMNEFNNTMASLPTQLRIPLEEAMNNTLVPRLEQLISSSNANVDTSNKIRRGIGNLSPDMLRSA